jgi:TRAP-type uncharacterized transport system fused permease subunit
VGFVIPYIFIYNPALLMQGSFLEIITLCILLAYAVFVVAIAFQGYFHRHLHLIERAISFIVAAVLIVLCCNTTFMHNLATQIVLIASAAALAFFFIIKKVASNRAVAV